MAGSEPGSDEALTKEEIQGSSETPSTGEKRKNACSCLPIIHLTLPPRSAMTHNSNFLYAVTALMAPRKKPETPARSTGGNPFKDRMGLGAYLADPSSLPCSVVVSHDADFVVIRDKYPKATVHLLILPRSPAISLLHPFDALADPSFLTLVRAAAARARSLAAAELQRLLGPHSAAEAARQAVLDGADGELPRGRDWEAEVMVGVHAVPSMRHLHVHVVSRDMRSEALRHRKHYNSFNTPFLVPLADFPLAGGDERRDPRGRGYMRRPLRCWRCGRDFGDRFARLKEHLEEEFEAWRRE
ncbi:aprataxin-like protein [Cordyceps fumosorosea ARSEF 2679]|uniref:Aprataxin-like protein n=1 Tax=Cordyceps fumosorosea (strain ARSEF 2679) TaxID=1081104 RepID=A0A167YBJ2_CORFA|nr:aprataxin-like protein [Cordyceps fumosorosea ARSEF 2679]OAA66119.1 aprataxin-like protein [Cordyceps fumosorosea ARSEF 2679]